MEEADFVLRLDIATDRLPELATVGDALIAWSEMLRAASMAVDETGIARVELAGVERGSQLFKIVLRRMESFAEHLSDGAAEYPLTAKAAMALRPFELSRWHTD